MLLENIIPQIGTTGTELTNGFVLLFRFQGHRGALKKRGSNAR